MQFSNASTQNIRVRLGIREPHYGYEGQCNKASPVSIVFVCNRNPQGAPPHSKNVRNCTDRGWVPTLYGYKDQCCTALPLPYTFTFDKTDGPSLGGYESQCNSALPVPPSHALENGKSPNTLWIQGPVYCSTTSSQDIHM